MNNRPAFSRKQLALAEPIPAFIVRLPDPVFNWSALVLLVLSLLIASLASAQTTTGDAALGATLYSPNCDPCQGAMVGSIRSAIKNAANAMEYLIVNRLGESSDD